MSEQELLELNELCQGLLDARLSPAEMERLSAMLRSSEEARRVYVRAAALAASLHQYAAELQTEPARPKIIAFPKWRVAAWALGSLAAAALIIVAFTPAVTLTDRDAPLADSAPTDATETVARITGAKDCAWNGRALAIGDELRAGQRIELAAGFVEVSFDSGAQVTMEGPATLEPFSAWRATLHRGSLRANVPSESVGFTVEHSSVEIVDLGTEFTMAVNESGEAEVFVLKGEVEAHPRAAAHPAALLLHEKDSRRFAHSGVFEVADHDRKLARWARRISLDRVAAPHFIRWSFDAQGAGGLAPSQSSGVSALKLLATAPDFPAAQVDGRYGQALRLDGRAAALRADLASLPPGAGRTLAFWVRVPADAPLTETGPMLAWSQPPLPATIALRWNRDPALGVVGALQTQVAAGFRTGSTALRDGQWHHVAVTFSALNARGKPKVQVKQYVDAHLDAVSARRNLKRRAEPSAPAANSPALFVGGAPGESTGFRGDLDELFIADRPLAPAEIRKLMRENRVE
jgi:ferric-dicitrate binding protein FerR (iron transport regulator)